MSTGRDGVRAKALSHEIQYGHHLLARHVELLDDLVDAEILEILDDRGLERSALDRWIRFDPQGYFDIQAPEVTYFDPFTERRVDGLVAMQVRLAPMKTMKPPFTDPRYDMIDPKVQRHGDERYLFERRS